MIITMKTYPVSSSSLTYKQAITEYLLKTVRKGDVDLSGTVRIHNKSTKIGIGRNFY